MFRCLCSKLNQYYFSDVEEEIFLSNCSSFSGVKYTFKAAWKSFLILYSLHGSQNYKPIACICLVLAFVSSIIGISLIYDLQPFTDRLHYNPAGLALEWPQIANSYKLYTFITCIFIHVNIVHVVNNVALLLFCGFYLEVKYGPIYLLAIFFTSAIFGEFGQLFMNTIGAPFPWTSTHAIYVGSSTGIMGVMGVFVAETFIAIAFDTNLIKYIYFKYVSTCLLSATFIFEVIYGIWYQEQVAVWMHIYGFAFGFIVLSVIISRKVSNVSGVLEHEKNSQYTELQNFSHPDEITLEDIDITISQSSQSAQTTNINQTIEEIDKIDWSDNDIGNQNVNKTKITHSCFAAAKRNYKKILFLMHFSIAIIYLIFVIFSIWRVFTFQ